MGHKTLAEKLDHIQKEDLGIHFDESLLWQDLNVQLGNKKKVSIDRRLWIAACITLLILFFPIILMVDIQPQQLAMEEVAAPANVMEIDEVLNSEQIVLNDSEEKVTYSPIHIIDKKGVGLELASSIDLSSIHLEPIIIKKQTAYKRQFFADQDISIIQASLGTPTIEKEKSVTITAQLNTSSQPVQLNNQAFKIKLFDRSNQ